MFENPYILIAMCESPMYFWWNVTTQIKFFHAFCWIYYYLSFILFVNFVCCFGFTKGPYFQKKTKIKIKKQCMLKKCKTWYFLKNASLIQWYLIKRDVFISDANSLCDLSIHPKTRKKNTHKTNKLLKKQNQSKKQNYKKKKNGKTCKQMKL